MFTTGSRGYQPSCVFFFFVVFILGSRSVIGKPQNFQKSTQPILRFSPELMMEPTLESAVSPISLLPRSPSGDPKKAPTPYKHGDAPDEDFPDLSLDLDGPPDKWEQDPDVLDSDIPLPRRWSDGVPEPPKKVFVPPNLEDDVDVDRLHGKLFGFREEDSDQDLGVPEAWQRLKTPESYPHSAETGSGYGPLPYRDADQEILGSEQLMDKDMDIDEAVLPPYTNLPFTDKAYALRTNAGPWKDVDRPTRPDSSRPNTRPTTSYGKTLSQWKELALSGLPEDTNINMYGDDEDLDLDGEKNPFVDDDDEEEDEVPEELVRQVVDAMEARPAWRELPAPKQERDRLARTLRTRDFDEDDNDDWFPRRRAEPQNSRLIALIFQTVDAPNALKTEDEKEDDLYEEKINIWQILTNFPFPMLLNRNDDRDDIAKTFDDEYDEEYYDDYDEDDYDDDEFDDDEYDDEDYEVEDGSEDEDVDDDDDDRDGTYDVTRDDDRLQFKQKDMENESDDVYDVFYEYEYEDCDDCSEDSYADESVQKEDFTILSLPPIFTR